MGVYTELFTGPARWNKFAKTANLSASMCQNIEHCLNP